jgi:hypothetical protein
MVAVAATAAIAMAQTPVAVTATPASASVAAGGPLPAGPTTFRVTRPAASNGATAPAPDATIRMVGLRFRGDRVLPRRGVVRVENDAGVPHMAVAFALRRGVGTARLGRALRSGSNRALAPWSAARRSPSRAS